MVILAAIGPANHLGKLLAELKGAALWAASDILIRVFRYYLIEDFPELTIKGVVLFDQK
jgi:hypothetical protein